MTKPQIWVAAFLAAFILLFMLGRLTKSSAEEEMMPGSNELPQTGMSSGDVSPEQLLGRLGCTNCHGQNLEGTKMGPALVNLNEHWSKNELTNYLRNPSSYMDNERFKVFKEKFPNVIMPAFGNVNVQELGKLAEYLLNR
ncbi:MAG: hypothetical protein AUK34_14315 [Ignavibacteria bacterium CG2_30_36_16]|nr:cytochrome c [Ignavibacteria bacterium]OIP54880.1 MAG: hypothetical protein AUK34_14315 [Ignavibacteria bacterium CG2_30_36_16]PJB00693.1 MAG: hypothetical protein CO127_07660 [Ignavibacteria bacterium CG_4_9_14_3_um_filter_36_18]